MRDHFAELSADLVRTRSQCLLPSDLDRLP